jgi:hypothetical protein
MATRVALSSPSPSALRVLPAPPGSLPFSSGGPAGRSGEGRCRRPPVASRVVFLSCLASLLLVASAALLVEIWRLWLAGGTQQPEERRSLLEVLRWAEPVASETASLRSTSNKPCAFLQEQDLEEFLPLLAGLGGEEVRRFVFRRAVSVLLLAGRGGGGEKSSSSSFSFSGRRQCRRRREASGFARSVRHGGGGPSEALASGALYLESVLPPPSQAANQGDPKLREWRRSYPWPEWPSCARQSPSSFFLWRRKRINSNHDAGPSGASPALASSRWWRSSTASTVGCGEVAGGLDGFF